MLPMPDPHRLFKDIREAPDADRMIRETYALVYSGLTGEDRRALVDHLAANGYSAGVIAAMLDVSPARGGQLLAASPMADRSENMSGLDGAIRPNPRYLPKGHPLKGVPVRDRPGGYTGPGRPLQPREDRLVKELDQAARRLAVMPTPYSTEVLGLIAELGNMAQRGQEAG